MSSCVPFWRLGRGRVAGQLRGEWLAGVPGRIRSTLRWHDLAPPRAWLARGYCDRTSRAPYRVGHRDPRMTVRYQHLAPGHLRDAMRALEQAATAAPAPVDTARADAR